MSLFVTPHAVRRYRERVADRPDRWVIGYLAGKVFCLADSFGAPFVRLAGGQRVILRNHAVVTVLPADKCLDRLSRRFDPPFHHAGEAP